MMILLRFSRLAALLAVGAASCVAAPDYPATPAREVIHEYGNVRLPDPFAWLEERNGETETWFRKPMRWAGSPATPTMR